MSKEHKFNEAAQQIRRLSVAMFALFIALAAILIYVMADPNLSALQRTTEADLVVRNDTLLDSPDYEKIENGVHVLTGFVEGEGLMTVVNNCTNCHSAKLVTQNRMTADGWRATIDWMQETQNLWDLGANEEIIVAYLAKFYAPEAQGRRQNLTNIEWYELKD